jgi:hypothetical protein
MVDVPVHRGHPPDASLRSRVLDGHHDVTEDAEPSTAVGLGVVAGRPHQGIDISHAPIEDGVDGSDRTSRRQQRDLEGARPERRELAGVSSGCVAHRANGVDVGRGVEAKDLVHGRHPRLERDEIVEQARDLDEVAKPSLGLRVLVVLPGLHPLSLRGDRRGPAGVVPHVQLVIDPSRRHGGLHPSEIYSTVAAVSPVVIA